MLTRDIWIRLGYCTIGSGSAYIWNKVSPIQTEGYPFVPPAALLAFLIANDDFGNTEKDIAAGALGFLCTAQAISIAKSYQTNPAPASDISSAPRENPSSDLEKIHKIRAVTSTLGAITGLINDFRGGAK